ncbi:MAG: transcriptional regulator [Dehalococcoidia bacterium]|nr:transcriptional regulator [Dehalococcoidia bacterium]
MTISADMVHLCADGAFAVDGGLRVSAWNSVAEALLGYSATDVLGRYCWEVLRAETPDGRVVCSPSCPAASEFHRCVPFTEGEVICPGRDGSLIQVTLSTMVVPPDSSTDGTLAIIFLHHVSYRPRHPGGSQLRLYSLGAFRAFLGETELPITSWKRKKSLSLLKYLAAHGSQPVHREAIIEFLWPEAAPSKGLERLKVVMYFLRRQLEGESRNGAHIVSDGEFYKLNPETLWTDVGAFEELAKEGTYHAKQREVESALERYQAAAVFYKGPFLQDEPYADWAMAERERLAEKYLFLLCEMAYLYESRNSYPDAIAAYQEALKVEPCREDIHRALMRALSTAGRHEEAVLQYRACQRVLKEELDVDPMAETVQLYQKILNVRQSTGGLPIS